jgi:hypothetical protein
MSTPDDPPVAARRRGGQPADDRRSDSRPALEAAAARVQARRADSAWDDDNLLAALRAAVRARSRVPPELVRAAKNIYTWHTINAGLATPTFEPEAAAGTGPEFASIRALTFSSVRLTIEVEVTENAVIGQVVPPRCGTVEAHTLDGASNAVPVDGIGCFSVEPIPPGPFRLRYRNPEAADVATSWITL